MAGTQHHLCDATVVGSPVDRLGLTRHRDVRADRGGATEPAVGGQHTVDADVHDQLPAC